MTNWQPIPTATEQIPRGVYLAWNHLGPHIAGKGIEADDWYDEATSEPIHDVTHYAELTGPDGGQINE